VLLRDLANRRRPLQLLEAEADHGAAAKPVTAAASSTATDQLRFVANNSLQRETSRHQKLTSLPDESRKRSPAVSPTEQGFHDCMLQAF
jgi:hypothetical protein